MAIPPYFAWEHKYHGVHNPWCYLWRLHRTYCWVLKPKCLAPQSRNFAKTNESSVDSRASTAITICFPPVVRVSIVSYWCRLHSAICISYQRSLPEFVRAIGCSDGLVTDYRSSAYKLDHVQWLPNFFVLLISVSLYIHLPTFKWFAS